MGAVAAGLHAACTALSHGRERGAPPQRCRDPVHPPATFGPWSLGEAGLALLPQHLCLAAQTPWC